MVKDRVKVIMIPHNHEYIDLLRSSLEKENVVVSLMRPFHYATPINFLKIFFLRFFGFRIIHIHWLYIFPFNFIMKFFIYFAKLLGYRIVWTVHNVLPHETNKKQFEKTKWFYQNIDYKFVHYKSNVEKIRTVLNVDIDKDIEIIYHPLFTSYPNFSNKSEARKKLNIPTDKKVVLGFGLIRKYKGMDLLAQAMKHLGKEYYGMIVGENRDPELVKNLHEIAKETDNLRIVPHRISKENVQFYFNACDVVLLPYYDITTSGVVLLSYAFDKPVVTTKVGGLPEIVIDGETGLLIEPNNLDAVIRAVKKIFKTDYAEMGKHAHIWAETKFNWPQIANQTLKVYRRIL